MTTPPESQAEWEVALQKLWSIIAGQPKCYICCPEEFKNYLSEGGHAATLPIGRYEELRPIVARANHKVRLRVSLILPLKCKLVPRKSKLEEPKDCAIILADVLAKRAFEFLTTLPLRRPARAILKENGLTLQDLARRENLPGPI